MDEPEDVRYCDDEVENTSNSLLVSGVLEPDVLSDGRYRCMYCDKILKNKITYNSHRYRRHHIVVRSSVKCPIADCDECVTTIVTLCEHMHEAHQFQLRPVEKDFASEAEFQEWYKELAYSENCEFVQQTARDAFPDKSTKLILRCNRSGIAKRRRRGYLRAGALKGSCKIGSTCPAYLRIRTYADDKIKATGQLNHFGHEIDLHILQLPDEIRNELQHLLLTGLREEKSLLGSKIFQSANEVEMELLSSSFENGQARSLFGCAEPNESKLFFEKGRRKGNAMKQLLDTADELQNYQIYCPECDISCLYSCFELCDHMAQSHKRPSIVRRVRCIKENLFKDWQMSNDIPSRNKKATEKIKKIELFCCNRSGKLVLISDDSSSIPVVSGLCTAFIRKITYSNGVIDLTFCSYHLEHDAEIALPQEVKKRLEDLFYCGLDENFALAIVREEFKAEKTNDALSLAVSKISLNDAHIMRDRAFQRRAVESISVNEENLDELKELAEQALSDPTYAVVYLRGEAFGDFNRGLAFGFMSTNGLSFLYSCGNNLLWIDKTLIRAEPEPLFFVGLAISLSEKRHCMVAYLTLKCSEEDMIIYIDQFLNEIVAAYQEV